MKKIILCAVVIILAGLQVAAQTIPINKRWGKVSKEEVEMTEYQLDTAATALILFEKKHVTVDFNSTGDIGQTIDVHKRIKILKEDGIDWGDFVIMRYLSSTARESVLGIEVVTYNMENGKVVTTKMSKDFIYEEEYSSNYHKISFYAQDVKVGSVIEVKYKVTSDIYWTIDDIYFQKTIPVNMSEVEVRVPGMFTFNKKLRGSHHVDYETDIEPRSIGAYQYEMGVDKFRTVDVPAFKYEPYIYYHDQFFLAASYDIRSLNIPGSMTQEYGVTWGDVDVSYRDSDIMTRFRSHCHFKDQVDALPKDATDDPARIASAVTLVKDNVVWNERYRVTPEPLAQVVKARSGSNADINCLIAGCLREMGYTVDMVFVKFRTSGHLLDFQPERFPFDTFILKVTAEDGSEYFLDGGSNHAYINVLPPDFLVPNARMIKYSGTGHWVDLTKLSRNSTVQTINATLTDDMRLQGSYVAKYTGVRSYAAKENYADYADEDAYISDIESDYGVEIDEAAFKEAKDYSASTSVEFTFYKDLDTAGDYIYVNPFLERFHSADSFQSIDREYPLDFPSAYAITYLFTFTIPEGYAVDQLPENKSFRFDPIGSNVRCISAVRGNTVQVSYSFTLGKMFCEVAHYKDLRTYWQYLAEIYDSVLVLKKQ
jgi:hypothetical protein